MCVDAELTRSVVHGNVFVLSLNATGFSSENVWLLFERVWLLDRMCLASSPNAFGIWSERVWLLVWTSLASRLNAFGFSFEHGWLLVWTRPDISSNSFIRGANPFARQMRYTLCLTGTVYSEETLRVNRRQPGGSPGNLRDLLMKSVVPRICGWYSWITPVGKKNWRSVRCSLSGHRLKLRWVCPNYQAYESLAVNKIWLPMDTERLGIP